jgi:RNA polymerase sigma-70 factor, ECF subfamily
MLRERDSVQHDQSQGYLQRLRRADPATCEELVRLHWQSVYRQHVLVCLHPELAADLTQETFVEAWKSVRSFRGEASVRTWLHTIAVRVWQRHLKRHKSSTIEPLTEAQSESVLQSVPGPEAQLEEKLDQQAMQSALAKLPEVQRMSVVLFYREQLTYEEIAKVTCVPLGTVKSRLHEGLKRLRRTLEAKREREEGEKN